MRTSAACLRALLALCSPSAAITLALAFLAASAFRPRIPCHHLPFQAPGHPQRLPCSVPRYPRGAFLRRQAARPRLSSFRRRVFFVLRIRLAECAEPVSHLRQASLRLILFRRETSGRATVLCSTGRHDGSAAGNDRTRQMDRAESIPNRRIEDRLLLRRALVDLVRQQVLTLPLLPPRRPRVRRLCFRQHPVDPSLRHRVTSAEDLLHG